MLRRLLRVRTVLAAGALSALPVVAIGQGDVPRPNGPLPLLTPAPLDEKQVKAWAQNLVARIDETWIEPLPAQRERKLLRLAESTPSELAFVTRVLRRHDTALSTVTLASLKDVFAVMRNATWADADTVSVQQIIAGWSVMVPELLKQLRADDASAELRRLTEGALVDLARLGRDPRLGSPPARQAWHAQQPTLSSMVSHHKVTVRLAALRIIAALGRDATLTSKAVTTALSDPDRFVRWSAVQTLKSLGTDEAALKAMAVLAKDDDPDVREAALAIVRAQPGGATALAQTKEAAPVHNPALVQPVVSKRLTAPPGPILPRRAEARAETPPPVTPAPEPRERLPMVPTQPARVTEKPAVVQPVAVRPEPIPAATHQRGSLRHVFTSSTPSTEATVVAAVPAMPAPLPPPVSKSEVPAPQPALVTPPVLKTTETQVTKLVPASMPPAPPRNLSANPAPVPLLLTPPPAAAPVLKSADFRPVSTTAPAVKIDLAELWLKKLSGTPADQVMALRELGKLKQGAAHCVPQMAELLIKGDVSVRREVPLALLQIGAPARIATSLLERALSDADTQVKVNAARCLVEMATK